MPDLNGKVGATHLGWPRCRWCHAEIEPDSTTAGVAWLHVTTGAPECAARSNLAEPVPQIHEEPFMEAAWEFVARYRRLRRVFRELSQSRASAVRRMQDYQDLVDRLDIAFEKREGAADGLGIPTWLGREAYDALKAIRDYRHSQVSAGWR